MSQMPDLDRLRRDAEERGRQQAAAEIAASLDAWLAGVTLFAHREGGDGSQMPIPDPTASLREAVASPHPLDLEAVRSGTRSQALAEVGAALAEEATSLTAWAATHGHSPSCSEADESGPGACNCTGHGVAVAIQRLLDAAHESRAALDAHVTQGKRAGWDEAVLRVYEGRFREVVGLGAAGFPNNPYRTADPLSEATQQTQEPS